ncbi:MAG: MarR family transcriptional regulator [Sphaerochaetaceae bacterium]|nr:MarR family transcriptional regulator [Sphaerochaetaceae bacterium]MDC7237010.1 MarR family transcriptional regulator [Sphaerochaetaceae bacterium]MDC7242755.1 MarR family transcriptional regulator [Sphaerochaetaceae bacterium]MDC7249985.1 MarR family transcriptional regulator [Sphaerochaetaceae bacterium]
MDRYSIAEDVFIALRKIDRAIDLHSKKLKKQFGLTGPQLMVLKAIKNNSNMQISAIAKDISLSQATVTSILDRLELQGYAKRQRSIVDKRKVNIVLTEKSEEILENDVDLIHEDFYANFNKLEDWEQMMILSSLDRLGSLLNVERVANEHNIKIKI